jgi:hypothetical protein
MPISVQPPAVFGSPPMSVLRRASALRPEGLRPMLPEGAAIDVSNARHLVRLFVGSARVVHLVAAPIAPARQRQMLYA